MYVTSERVISHPNFAEDKSLNILVASATDPVFRPLMMIDCLCFSLSLISLTSSAMAVRRAGWSVGKAGEAVGVWDGGVVVGLIPEVVQHLE